MLTPNGLEEGRVSPLKRREKLDPSRLSVGFCMRLVSQILALDLSAHPASRNHALNYLLMPATSAVLFFCISRVQRLAFFRVIGAYSLIWRHKNSRVLWINTTSKHWLFLLEKVICIIQFKVFACKSVFPTVSVSRVTMQLFDVAKHQKTVLRDSAKSLFFVLLQNIAILHNIQAIF